MEIVRSILMWPSMVIAEVQAGDYLTPAIGLAASTFLVGLPNGDMDFYQMAYWYGVTGVAQYGSKVLAGGSMTGPNPPMGGGGPSKY